MGLPARWYIDTALHMQIVCQIFKFKSFFLRFSSCVCVFVAFRRSCVVVTRKGHVQTDKQTFIHLRKYITYVRHERECLYTCIPMWEVYVCYPRVGNRTMCEWKEWGRQKRERERGKCHVCFCYEDLSLFAIKSIIAIENTANKLLNY